MATYPSGIYAPRTMTNRAGVSYDVTKTKIVFAEDINSDRAEIVAIETELGTLPKGSSASVKARLEAIEALIPASGGGATNYKFRAYRSSNVTITTVTATDIIFDAENFDPGDDYNSATGDYTAPVAGYYFLAAQITFDPCVVDKKIYVNVRKDGTNIMVNSNHTSKVDEMSAHVSGIYYLSAGSVIDVRCYHNFGVNGNLLGTNPRTFFAAHLLSI